MSNETVDLTLEVWYHGTTETVLVKVSSTLSGLTIDLGCKLMKLNQDLRKAVKNYREAGYFLLSSRKCGESAKVKITISSPVLVLIS